MSNQEYNQKEEERLSAESANAENVAENTEKEAPEANEEAKVSELDQLKSELAEEKKQYLFLRAEFDNFRKRTIAEKTELIKNGGEQAFKGLLPIIDDFERGLKANKESNADSAVVEGMELIYNKLKKYLEQNGVKEFGDETEFDTDRHEAVAMVPVPDESLKGKIIDTVEKGYMINDKVLRHAKVVVGQK
jgi:molecular chaperone GrpE